MGAVTRIEETRRQHSEIQFCRMLDELYSEDPTQGDTNEAIRRERCRRIIQRYGAADRLVARSQTMAQAFERVYGEPLIPEQHENGDGQ